MDVWAIGCIMAELLDGQPLFAGDTELDQLCVSQRAFACFMVTGGDGWLSSWTRRGVLLPMLWDFLRW